MFNVPDGLPRFLIISPPKTGSTWLADNLRCHPQLWVPAGKEVKYFSSLFRWLDLGWYAAQFAAPGRMAGEASPTYAPLPLARIRAIRDLMPDVKLIFLLRDPVSRAWSHAKHLHRYHEACFENCTTPLEEVSDNEWKRAFRDEWLTASGDYVGQLRRWLTVFPREQVFIEFFESIVEMPEKLLLDVFSFLGVSADVKLDRFPLHERILPGPQARLPRHLENDLRSLLGGSSMALAESLSGLGYSLPESWGSYCRGAEPESPAFSDVDLERITAKEATFRTAFRQLHLDFRGYDLLFYRGRLLAVPMELGPIQALDGPPLEQYLAANSILAAATLPELKEVVTTRVLAEQKKELDRVSEELREVQAESARLRTDLQTLVDEVRSPVPPLWQRKLRGFGRRIARQLRF